MNILQKSQVNHQNVGIVRQRFLPKAVQLGVWRDTWKPSIF